MAFAIGVLFVWVAIPDRFYYLFGFYPVLFAAGAVVSEGVVDGRRGFFRRTQRHAWLWRSRRVAVGIVIVNALLFLPLGLPVLPGSAVAAADLNTVNYNLGEEIGWPDLVHQVDEVWKSLPDDERRRAVVTDLELRRGRRTRALRPRWIGSRLQRPQFVLVVGTSARLRDHRRRGRLRAEGARVRASPACRLITRVHNSDDVHNDEDGAPISVCRDPVVPWHELWSWFKHYG